jgi:hypothetical protein
MVDAFAIQEDFEVLGSDNRHVGEVDRLVEEGIKLTRRDAEAAGRHHLIPLELVDRVVADERKVFLKVDKDEAERRWRPLD